METIPILQFWQGSPQVRTSHPQHARIDQFLHPAWEPVLERRAPLRTPDWRYYPQRSLRQSYQRDPLPLETRPFEEAS